MDLLDAPRGPAKDRPFQGRRQHLRQQQVWNRAQLIARRRVSSDIHAYPAQLLDEPPNFRSARPDLFRNLRAADDNRSVPHQ
jgi:hypothetical protein